MVGNQNSRYSSARRLGKLEKELDTIVRKFDYLGEKCVDTEDVESIKHNTEDLEVNSVLRRWRASLLNQKQEILKEEKKKEKQEKCLSENIKMMVTKDAIQVKLMGPSNFLAWVT